MMTFVQPSIATAVEQKCTSFSRSRDRECLAFGRYDCRDDRCGHRSCGLHVVRNTAGIFCPHCGGPVRVNKH